MRKTTGSYPTYSIPGKSAALVPEFEVENLPSAELHSLGFSACSEGPAFGQNTDIYRGFQNYFYKLLGVVEGT